MNSTKTSNRLKIDIQAKCNCQLIVSTPQDGTYYRAWDEGDLQSVGFTSIPGVIKTSGRNMQKIYLKHLKPFEKVDLPQTRNWPIVAIFVK